MNRFSVRLYIDGELTETHRDYMHRDKAEKLAVKLTRLYKGPKAIARVSEVANGDRLFPEEKVVSTWQMGRRIKN